MHPRRTRRREQSVGLNLNDEQNLDQNHGLNLDPNLDLNHGWNPDRNPDRSLAPNRASSDPIRVMNGLNARNRDHNHEMIHHRATIRRRRDPHLLRAMIRPQDRNHHHGTIRRHGTIRHRGMIHRHGMIHHRGTIHRRALIRRAVSHRVRILVQRGRII